MKTLYRKFKNLKYRYKLTLLILAAGLIPVMIIVVYMQTGMTNILHANEVDSMENTLEQSVEAIENQEMIYENLVDYLSYSQDLRSILTTEPESDYRIPCYRCRRSITKRSGESLCIRRVSRWRTGIL